MKVWWPEKKIMEFVYVYIDLWKIDTIITFDENGVSGHANHRAISAAISRAVHTDPKFPTTYVLRSASLLSKYASLFSLPYSILNHHRTRKLLFSTFDRPPFHPSLDSKKISRNVIKILSDLNLTSPLRSKDRSSNSKKLSNYPPYKFDLLQKNKNHHKNIYNSKKKSKMIEKSYVAYEEGEDDDELRDLDNEDNEEFRKVKTLEKIRRMRMSERKTHQSFFLSDLEQYYRTRRAFNQHRSQKVWFRRLWLIFSRYMWINELHRVVPIEYRFNDDGVIDDDDDDYDDYEGDFSRSITNDDDDQNR
ncbi:hypothetical protein BY996DRAFT_6993907 [Phakopsora pachyrhizi]|nr:hypothetical protein BY996DRAFT_6993907 [Phakopsora pachyrhizi]